MKINNFYLILSFLALSSFAGIALQIHPETLGLAFQEKPQKQTSFSYNSHWSKVDSLENKGLTKSALEEATKIYNQAKKENNAPNIVKALIYQMKYESVLVEGSNEKSILKLEDELKKSNYPIKPMLHSLVAETYWRYLQRNRYKFYNRTETVDFTPNDINTWTIWQLNQKIIFHYKTSIADAESLKKYPLNIYDPIIVSGQSEARKLRPSLYDFLTNRALDYFMSSESYLEQFADQFEISDAHFFKPYDEFSKLKIESKDSASLKLLTIKTLQAMILFHKNDEKPEALIDVDLKRLEYLKGHAIIENKDSLYFQALETLQSRFKEHPSSAEVSYLLAEYFKNEAEQYNPQLSDDHKWKNKKALEICETAISKFPSSHGAKQCKYLLAQIKEKELGFTIEKVNSTNKPFRVLIKYKNVGKVYARIIPISIEKFGRNSEEYYGEDLINQYLKLSAVKEWEINLPVDNDYNAHSVEVKIPESGNGHYVLLLSDNPQFKYIKNAIAYDDYWVSDMSYLVRSNRIGSTEVIINDRNSGQALKDVNVTLWYQKYNNIKRKYEMLKGNTLISDNNGVINIQAGVNDSRNFYLEFKVQDDYLFSEYPIYVYNYAERKENLKPKTFFFTDRAIYRPGQIVHFKGIMIETDGKINQILPDINSTVTLFDVNGQKVSSLDLNTNEYGTFSGSFAIPLGLLTGQMRIADPNGNHYISVEEYKRPKFEVALNPAKGEYKLNDTINITGNAKAYSGANIDGAKVQYRITRRANFPKWWLFRGYYPYSSEMEITSGTASTSEIGEFNIKFLAIPDFKVSPKFQPVFTYSVSVDVTDINGETQSSSSSVSVGYKSLLVDVEIPDYFNKDGKGEFKVNTANLNGEPVPAQVEFTVHKLKQPERIFRNRLWERPDKFIISKEDYYKNFPNDIYDDETNRLNWEREKSVFDAKINTQNEKVLKLDNIQKWDNGIYVLIARSKDKYGEAVEEQVYFTLYSDKENSIPEYKTDWLVDVKTKAEPGENAEFLLGTKENYLRVLFETEWQGKIVTREIIELSNEQRKITIPVKEEYRGNFSVHFTAIKNGRDYRHTKNIVVPYSNKELDIQFETFRNKLQPGQQEEWKIKIKGPKGEKVASEMLATLYDASLDEFRENKWAFDIYKSFGSSLYWQARTFEAGTTTLYARDWNVYPDFPARNFDKLNWFGFEYGYFAFRNKNRGFEAKAAVANELGDIRIEDSAADENSVVMEMTESESKNKVDVKDIIPSAIAASSITLADKRNIELPIQPRKNFNETAFFYPHLQTDPEGNVIIKFTIPEALTKWKMLGFAHTKDLQYGLIKNELVTQKELMIVPNAPRFFRENDKMEFSAKIQNLSDGNLTGKADIFLYDAITMKEITWNMVEALHGKFSTIGERDFTAAKGKSAVVAWNIAIPEGIGAITYKVVAKAGNFTDGEEMIIPVLTNRMLVTETLPLPIKGKETKNFKFEKLIHSGVSSTLKNHKLTVEFTSNPAWYAIQALPYMMEYPYECSEQIFSRYYANSIASHIANSSPKIKAVFDSWRTTDKESLISNLEKNQELKSALLEETPWVLDAKDESERKRRVALLFDLNKMSSELESAQNKLLKLQMSNGGWSWFAGMPDERYITQHIVAGFGHLRRLGIKKYEEDNRINQMIKKAIHYLDERIKEDYDHLIKSKVDLSKNNISYVQIHYLYTRSFFKEIVVDKSSKKAYDYYFDQMKKYWLSNNIYMQGMIALSLHRNNETVTSNDIMKSLKERSITNEELGMYWKEIESGYYWYQAPVETQSLLIEAFDEVANDKNSVNEMCIWLLKQKQTQDWKTTKATAEACYALLLRGTDWLSTESNIEIKVGEQKINPKEMPDIKVEAGTGYFKTSWTGTEIKPEMGNVSVSKTDEGVSWGALYWQYFEQLDKITSHESPLKIDKKLFLEKSSEKGPVMTSVTEETKLEKGDKIIVRIEIRTDRNMDYVHLKDMRASALEPINVISQYKYQGGIGYYESTRDAATNFFISHLNKGTYVFEYPLRVSFSGNFSNGITTIQSMYAPEFSSHSEGIRITVE